MTVQELVDRLGEFDEGAEVRFAYQPSWPLQDHVGDVRQTDDRPACPNCERHVSLVDVPAREGEAAFRGYLCPSCGRLEEDEVDVADAANASVVFLVSGGQVRETPYAPGELFNG